jgi:hypothetical protein
MKKNMCTQVVIILVVICTVLTTTTVNAERVRGKFIISKRQLPFVLNLPQPKGSIQNKSQDLLVAIKNNSSNNTNNNNHAQNLFEVGKSGGKSPFNTKITDKFSNFIQVH